MNDNSMERLGQQLYLKYQEQIEAAVRKTFGKPYYQFNKNELKDFLENWIIDVDNEVVTVVPKTIELENHPKRIKFVDPAKINQEILDGWNNS